MRKRITVDLPEPEERHGRDPYFMITPETGEIRECNSIRPLLSAACQDVGDGRVVVLTTADAHHRWVQEQQTKKTKELLDLQSHIRSIVKSMTTAAPSSRGAYTQQLANLVPWPEGDKPGWSQR